MKAWLKLGFWFAGIILLLNSLLYIGCIQFGSMGDMGESIVCTIFSLPDLIFWFPLIFGGVAKRLMGDLSNKTVWLIMYFSGVLIWFVIGAIIGLIIGKIKSRKKL